MSTTTQTVPQNIASVIETTPRGEYQSDLLAGRQRWSGSDLKGRAARYASRYAESRQALLVRIQTALRPLGWAALTDMVAAGGAHRTRELIVVAPTGERIVWGG